MTVSERNELFKNSTPRDPADPHSRRFAIRRTGRGLECYDLKWTRDVGGEPEFHGHPASRVPPKVLRTWHSEGLITTAKYTRLLKELPGC